jgi:glutamate N-acetyltransferase/amino-acid N-acetyltransferase
LAFETMINGSVTSPAGFSAGAAACGLKKPGKLDLTLLYSERDCTAAAVFTRNQVVAAPVILDREILSTSSSRIRGIVANAGIANACTGEQGLLAARQTQEAAAEHLSCRPEQLFVLSTGVIGVQLPMAKIREGLHLATGDLAGTNGPKAAQAIMTTDTRPKQVAIQVPLAGGHITIGGMAKGSGMIHPDMATMLAVITTDADIPADLLQQLLVEAVEPTFNCISVDGDTSTNDTVLLLANGAARVSLVDQESLDRFGEGLNQVCMELAKMIIRDGEGASKFVEILVSGARTRDEAKAVAATIATSPLVKTALAGNDPNWGRIMMAAGRAGVSFDQNRVGLWTCNPGSSPLGLVIGGMPTDYAEADAVAIFSRPEINLHLDLGQGSAEAILWTTDLTHEYVSINGDYRT